MQVFLYEYITAGGLLSTATAPRGSLLREGLAMVTALAEERALSIAPMGDAAATHAPERTL